MDRGPQGPVACVTVGEVSIGRSKSARKLVQGIQRAAQTQRFRLPITVRDVEIVLRDDANSPAPAAGARSVDPNATGATSAGGSTLGFGGDALADLPVPEAEARMAERAGPSGEGGGVKAATAGLPRWKGLLRLALRWVGRFAGGIGLRLGLAVLPGLPFRIKGIVVKHEVRCICPLSDRTLDVGKNCHSFWGVGVWRQGGWS
jgi:hypothetical protein